MAENDYLAAIRSLIKSEMVDLNTSISGEVVSYSKGNATIKPIGNKRFQDGESLPFPLIYNVPIRWPSFNGGQCGFKAPIKKGDKVLIVFSQQATDGTDDLRRFDLSDAYAIPADNDQSDGGSNNEDTIMYFGSASIRITAAGEVIITAPKGIIYDSPSLDVSYGGLGTTMNLTGTLLNNNVNVGHNHRHSGVQTGPSDTGNPI